MPVEMASIIISIPDSWKTSSISESWKISDTKARFDLVIVDPVVRNSSYEAI